MKSLLPPKFRLEKTGNLFRLPTYYIPSGIALLLSAIIDRIFLARIVHFPTFAGGLISFIIAVIVAAIVQAAIVQLLSKISKIENRSWDKALFISTGGSLIRSVFMFLGVQIASRFFSSIVLILGLVAGWFFVKRVFEINTKKLTTFILWFMLFLGVLALVLYFVGTSLLHFVAQK